MDNIFDIRKLDICLPTEEDVHTAFTRYELCAGKEYDCEYLPLNFLLFVLKGEISVICNEFTGHFRSDEMILLRRSSTVKLQVVQDAVLVAFHFDMFLATYEQQAFRALLPNVEKTTYRFNPVPMPEPIRLFLEQLIYFQSLNVDCQHFNEVKHCELFILIRYFCSRDEIIALLTPLISESQSFRAKVLDKYPKLTTGHITELAGLVGMGRKNFDRRFNEEFGTSPARWIQQEIAKKVRLYLSKPDINIADAIEKFHFNSPSQFNRFCRRHFDKTPGGVIKEARK